MRILVACEFSGIISQAFKLKGHSVTSCDIRESLYPENHYRGDVMNIVFDEWDLIIAHPPCQYLSLAGTWALSEKYGSNALARQEAQNKAIDFFKVFTNLNCKRVCIENPKGVMSRCYKKPAQIIQPYYFGDNEMKTTCLWLKNLPRLNGNIEVAKNKEMFKPLPKYVDAKGQKRYFSDYSSGEQKRSMSFKGMADAMAEQWNFIQ